MNGRRGEHVCLTGVVSTAQQEPVNSENCSILGCEGPRHRMPPLGVDRPADRLLFREEAFQQ